MTSTAPQPRFRLRSVALAAYGPTLVKAVGHGAVLPVLALRARELGADVGTAALVVALLGVGQLLTSLPAGALVARIGERRALLLAGLLDAVAMVVAATADDVARLGAGVVLSGATWTVFLLARQGFMIDVVPAGVRARALSTLGGTFRIGLLVGPLLGSGVIAAGGVVAVFWLATGTSAAAGVLAVVVPEPGRSVTGPGARRPRLPGPPERVLSVLAAHRGVLVPLGSAVVVIGTVRSLRSSLLPLWAESVGLSPEQTSLVFAIATSVDVALFYPAGLVMDRYGRTGVAVAVAATISVGVLLLPLATGFVPVLAVAAVMAVGNGLGSGIVMTLGADSAPVRGRAQFLGGWRLAADVGSTGGPLLVAASAAVAPLAVACLVTGTIGLLGTGWVARQVARSERRRTATMVP